MVYFRQDASPILDMTDAEWLADANRTLIATVKVVAPEVPTFALTTASRCVAGKVTLVATLAHTGDVAVDALVQSPYGSSQANGLAAGKSNSVTFSTRLGAMEAGALTAKVTTSVNGQPVTKTCTAEYSARSCG
ncbi:hypothetical protein ACSBPH_02475 [Microbacterium sp. F51-2R]|uniref:hypothetical protein n=1 Tax=Microbacterium sp. F51-2R TaxID=3445777 RepID=UPI003FA05DB5